jgi:hypothetical protein
MPIMGFYYYYFFFVNLHVEYRYLDCKIRVIAAMLHQILFFRGGTMHCYFFLL